MRRASHPATAILALAVATALMWINVPGARAQPAVDPLPLPPGTVLTGPVFRSPSSGPPNVLPSITTGADANVYVGAPPTSLSFVPSAPAFMVVTAQPTQYIRVYCPECTPSSLPNRSFIGDPGTIRGLTPAQIRDVLALPATPSMVTIATIPAGACVLSGTGAAIAGFGRGGTAQQFVAGIPTDPTNCAGLSFLPAENYINRQAIGDFALVYGPRAGGGNAGAIAAALDWTQPKPAPFTDMDLLYKSLDLLNFGDPAPLRGALVQLDGEIYADLSSAVIGAGQLYLGAIREQMRAGGPVTGKVQLWATAFGGAGGLSGSGDRHDVDAATGGISLGAEHRFEPGLLAGLAVGYARSGFDMSSLSGSGDINTFMATPYVRYEPGRWYVEGAIGAAYNDSSISRDIVFPGQNRTANGDPHGWAFLSQVETGYRVSLDSQTDLTPFVGVQGIVFDQSAFDESGAGAANLNVDGHITKSVRGILGAEVQYALPVGLAAPLRLTGRFGWAHELADTERSATAFLVGTPGASFNVNGASAPRDAAVFGAGARVAVDDVELFVRYEGQAGDGALQQGGSAGARFRF